MAKTREAAVAVVGIDIGKYSFHVVGPSDRHRFVSAFPSLADLFALLGQVAEVPVPDIGRPGRSPQHG